MRNRKWLVIGLIASVAVNLALGGFLAGHASRGGPSAVTLDPSLGLFRVVRELPEDRRESFRPVVREHFQSIRRDLRRMRKAQGSINRALEQAPFEPEALDAALDGFRAALLEVQQENHALLVRVAESMTPEERQALREVMTRHRHEHRHSGSSDRKDR